MGEHSRRAARSRRQLRVRQKVAGTAERPRLNVFRSLAEIYAQVIDDGSGQTMVSASTLEADLRPRTVGLNKTEQAKLIGTLIAERARAKGIQRVVFDRGGYRYHGRVQALAEAARQA
ncbi:MAG TPA: 50S ribosomal protein L18, partial [Anaerolineales bacterium]|nr:50S ribosomal protein L18 [Anaerolineales bacterium]